MSFIQTPQKALESEFCCYYNADELGFVNTPEFRNSLPRRAWESAQRLSEHVGTDKIADLVALLLSMKAEPYGDMMLVIMQTSLMGWQDDPESWAVFKDLIDLIIKNLRTPSPRPT